MFERIKKLTTIFKNPIAYIPANNQDNLINISLDNNGCIKTADCYNKEDGIHTYYSHESILELLPYALSAIETKSNLIFGNGLIPKDSRNAITVNKFLNASGKNGRLYLEEIKLAIRDYIEYGKGLIYVNNNYIEKLDVNKVRKMAYIDTDASSWNKDLIGIIYDSGDDISNNNQVNMDEIKKRIQDGETSAFKLFGSKLWFIPKSQLVMFGDIKRFGIKTSIFDKERNRIQYVLERYRYKISNAENNEMSSLILRMTQDDLRTRASYLGIDPNLLDTPEGLNTFISQFKIKLESIRADMKRQITGNNPSNLVFLDSNLFGDFMEIKNSSGKVNDDTSKELDEIAVNIMSSLTGIPASVLSFTGDSYVTGTQALLKYLQETIISGEQSYINNKLREISQKIKIPDMVISEFNFTNSLEIVDKDKKALEIVDYMISCGIPTDKAYQYMNDVYGIKIDTTGLENLRLIGNKFQTADNISF